MTSGLISCFLIASAVALLASAITLTNVPPPVTRGFRGLLRHELRKKSIFRVFDYGVRLFSLIFRGRLSIEQKENIESELICSGELWGLTGCEYVGAVGVFSLISALASWIGYRYLGWSVSVSFMCFSIGSALPMLQLKTQKNSRQKSIERALPFVLDLIYMTMGAGLNLHQALGKVIDNLPDRKSPIRFELKRLLYDLQIGATLIDAMKNFARRVQTETAEDFAHWVIQSEEKGTSLRRIFQKQAESLRQKRSVMAEESAARAGAALMLPMTMMFFVVMIIVLTPLLLKMKGVNL